MLSLFKYQQNRWYWKLRYYLKKFLFYIHKTYFITKERTKEARESFSISLELINIISYSFLLAVIIVVILIVLENQLIKLAPLISREFISRKILDNFSILHNELISFTNTLNTLYATVASITGIFLGLYYTAISIVISTVYTNVPSEIRELLLKEKTGNIYIKILAWLISVSIILLGYSILGGNPGILNSLCIILVGCFGILSFIQLGRMAFHFFNPEKISEILFYALYNYIKLSTIKGSRWSDPNFQAYMQRIVEKNISILDDLIKECSKKQHLQKPLLSILKKIIYFLIYYEEQRLFIPSNSRWYSLIPRYRSWFLSDSSSLTVAMQTQTSMQPELIPNPNWIEDKIAEILSPVFELSLEKEELEIIYNILYVLNFYFENLGKNLELRKAKNIIIILNESIDKYYNTHTISKSPNKYKNYELELFDVYGLTIISFSIGFFKFLRDTSSKNILEKIDKINWMSKKNIYKKGFPSLLLPQVEFIYKRLQFEIKVEKKIISPDWYIRQLIIIRYLELFQECVNEILSSIEDFFISKSGSLLSKKSYILAAHHSQRGLEMCNKMTAHIPYLKALIEELEKYVINKEINLPRWNWNQIKDIIDKSHDILVENLAKCIPALSLIEIKEDFPDLFGQIYNTVCQDCYDSMILKQAKKFKKLFPPLFIGSFKAHEKLKTQLQNQPKETLYAISFEPLLDIMTLSGYALIYSELYGIANIWEICKIIWDNYFETHSYPNEAMRYLIESYKLRKSIYGIFERDILRTNWKLRLEKKLREMNLIYDRSSSSYSWDESDEIKHESPLIRSLCRGRYDPHISPIEIFIITYLLIRPESKDIEFNDRYDLAREIKEEYKKKEKRNKEGDN